MVRGDIVRINTITHQKEDFPAGDARGTISAMRFRPENGDVILLTAVDFTYKSWGSASQHYDAMV